MTEIETKLIHGDCRDIFNSSSKLTENHPLSTDN